MPNFNNRAMRVKTQSAWKKTPGVRKTSQEFVVEVHDTNSKHDQEYIRYFCEAASALDEIKDVSEKGCITDNALEQTVGKEVELSCDRAVSRCIEKLLENCSNPYIVIRFLEAFSQDISTVCMDQCASHVTEKLLRITMQIVKNLPLSSEVADAEEKNNIIIASFFWGYKFGQFFSQYLELCLNDTYGCHVLNAVIQLLGCCQVNESILHNRSQMKFEKYMSNENSFGLTEIFPAVPLIFHDLIKHIAKKIIEHPHLSDLLFDSRSSRVIQNLLLILKKRNLKYFGKVVQVLFQIIFSKRNEQGVPLAMCDKSCSYLMERIIGLSGEHEQELIWLGINQCLPELILNPIGNFTIQTFFYSVHKKQQFESMFDATIDHFEKILENQYFGIWLSIAKSCNRFKTRQVQFLSKMMHLLKSTEPTERQSYFVQLLLGFQTYDEFQKRMPTASHPCSFPVNLLGSLIVQEIFKFSKPYKAVRSILSMKSEGLMFLACQQQGCHVLTSFLESTNIAKKDKEKLIKNLKPVSVSIACDSVGNLTLSRLWCLLSVDQKLIISEELFEKKTSLLEHKWGASIFKKFALVHFENKHKWKEIQKSFEKKQQMLKEIVA